MLKALNKAAGALILLMVGSGVWAQSPPPSSGPKPAPSVPARGPSAAVALEMAQAAVGYCSAFHVAAVVLDAAGLPKIYYVPDGTQGRMAEFAARKARAALRYKVATSQVTARAAADPAFAAEVGADATLLGRPGAVPLMVNGELIGAIGIGGAPVSEDDEACAAQAVEKLKSKLQ